MKRCEDCIYFDQCGQEVACEDFYDGDDDALALNDYEEDLRSRVEEYDDYLQEQNG